MDGEVSRRDAWILTAVSRDFGPTSFALDQVDDETQAAVAQETVRAPSCSFVSRWRRSDGLVTEVQVKKLPNTAAVEITPTLRNESDRPSARISRWRSIDNDFAPVGGRWRTVRYASGALATPDDFAVRTSTLLPGANWQIAAGGGRSSSEYLPFADFSGPAGGLMIGIGWSGQWHLLATVDATGDSLNLAAGLELTNFRLNSGESVTGPSVTVLFYDRRESTTHPSGQADPQACEDEAVGDARAINLWRAMVREHYTPPNAAKPAIGAVAATWGGTPARVHEALVDQIEQYGVGVDAYWIDAAWHGHSELWWTNAGSWRPRRSVYPEGLEPVTDRVHEGGRRFVLWFEPERICATSDIANQHPEWLLTLPPESRTFSTHDQSHDDFPLEESRHNDFAGGDSLLDLGDDEARAWLVDRLTEAITRWKVDVFRQDFNVAPLDFWRHCDVPDREGITELRYIRGLYDVWDRLAERNPGLIIDNCASGGRRLDLEALRRTIVLSRSDLVTNAEAHQQHTAGLSRWLPFHAPLVHCGYDEYALDSALGTTTSLSWAVHFNQPEPSAFPDTFPFEAVAEQLKRHDAVRWLLAQDFYDLSPQAPSDWVVLQFADASSGRGVVLAYRQPGAGEATAVVRPVGDAIVINPESSSGASQRDRRLEVNLPEPRSSAIIHYQSLAQCPHQSREHFLPPVNLLLGRDIT